MEKTTSLIALVFTTLTLAACVQVSVENPSRAKQLAISSVRDLPLSYPKGSLFSLSPKYVKETSLKAKQTQTIYQLYTNAIEADLQQNGFVNTKVLTQANFYVGFGIALTEDFSDDKINKKFGISPGLPEQDNLKKGSFLIYIENAQTGERVWRGIAQGFANEKLSTEQRVQRTETIVATVMKQFYQTN
ncbi:hypothetical protein A9Q74_01785 [Colwellia sp. 39_35_sub15_T18]|nr:hypothetical protein A9Q74_01785 [Colwellia sp. 39_35_sub15_T18]